MAGRWRYHALACAIVVAGAGAALAPLRAQSPAGAAQPTAANPIRFTAFGVNAETGASGRMTIVIERWSTDAERTTLLSALVRGGQEPLLDAIHGVKERAGYIRTDNTSSWDLKYCRDNRLPDGTRQIVIVTDKPVTFFARASGRLAPDYPFTLLELRVGVGGQGEGRVLAQTAIDVKNGRLELESYSQEPIRLTSIVEEKRER